MVFSVGETVVYPHHGAALIEAIETRVIKGEEKLYLVLRVAQGDLTVRVPAENAEIVGVREVVGEEGLTKVFDVLRAPHTEEPTNWSRRYKANLEKLASGNPLKVAEVVRDLWRREGERGLSAGEVLAFRAFAGPVAVVVAGGDTRKASVAAALAAVPDGYEIVLVHGAARALAPTALVEAVAAAVRGGADAVIPVLPVIDTIKEVAAGTVVGTVDRSVLRAVQTPQGFRRAVLAAAHAAAADEHTDDAGLVEKLGVAVGTVPGHEAAFKITRPVDLVFAEALLASGTLGS